MSQSSHGGSASIPSPNIQGHSLGESNNKHDGNIAVDSEGDVFTGTPPGPHTPSKAQAKEYHRSPSGTSPASQKRKVARYSPVSSRTDSVIQGAWYSPSHPTNKQHTDSAEMEIHLDGEGKILTLFSVADLENALKHCKLMAYQVANSFGDDEMYEPSAMIKTAYRALGLLLEIPKQTHTTSPSPPFEGINASMHAPTNTLANAALESSRISNLEISVASFHDKLDKLTNTIIQRQATPALAELPLPLPQNMYANITANPL
ncbi:hypothetical protein K439DRAFT_1613788 [Ramaria rubella]|nr:hypothetical protein K439DRAFT_1613788 [Ramaria rubella]